MTKEKPHRLSHPGGYKRKLFYYVPRHVQAIENEGQTPSVDLLFQLAEMFDVSLDRHIFKDRDTIKSSIRRRVDTLLDGLTDSDLIIIEATAKGIHKTKELPEE